MFSCLTDNAIKFTATGRVDISLSVLEQTEESVKIHFKVKDTGIGIDDTEQKSIFFPFTQVDES